MEATIKDGENGPAPQRAGCFRSTVGVGLGLGLGALTGIVVGLVVGVGIALILGVL